MIRALPFAYSLGTRHLAHDEQRRVYWPSSERAKDRVSGQDCLSWRKPRFAQKRGLPGGFRGEWLPCPATGLSTSLLPI